MTLRDLPTKETAAEFTRPWTATRLMEIQAHMRLIEQQRDFAIATLTRIAAFNDSSAEEVLRIHGNYSAFDEPASVEIARQAIEEIERSKQ